MGEPRGKFHSSPPRLPSGSHPGVNTSAQQITPLPPAQGLGAAAPQPGVGLLPCRDLEIGFHIWHFALGLLHLGWLHFAFVTLHLGPGTLCFALSILHFAFEVWRFAVMRGTEGAQIARATR